MWYKYCQTQLDLFDSSELPQVNSLSPNPRQYADYDVEDLTFYHGSPEYLEDGAILVPGQRCEKGDCHEEVYITTNIGIAQQFATYDGWVYMVQPIGEVKPDFSDDNGIPITFTCKSAKVLTTVW